MPKISVPQRDGEITLRVGSHDPVTYPVSNGVVDVPAAEADNFLSVVDGARASSSGGTSTDKAATVETPPTAKG